MSEHSEEMVEVPNPFVLSRYFENIKALNDAEILLVETFLEARPSVRACYEAEQAHLANLKWPI